MPLFEMLIMAVVSFEIITCGVLVNEENSRDTFLDVKFSKRFCTLQKNARNNIFCYFS
jgi:hypothetical protein